MNSSARDRLRRDGGGDPPEVEQERDLHAVHVHAGVLRRGAPHHEEAEAERRARDAREVLEHLERVALRAGERPDLLRRDVPHDGLRLLAIAADHRLVPLAFARGGRRRGGRGGRRGGRCGRRRLLAQRELVPVGDRDRRGPAVDSSAGSNSNARDRGERRGGEVGVRAGVDHLRLAHAAVGAEDELELHRAGDAPRERVRGVRGLDEAPEPRRPREDAPPRRGRGGARLAGRSGRSALWRARGGGGVSCRGGGHAEREQEREHRLLVTKRLDGIEPRRPERGVEPRDDAGEPGEDDGPHHHRWGEEGRPVPADGHHPGDPGPEREADRARRATRGRPPR